MNLLLDTHVWLWGVGQPARISPSALRALRAPDTRIWLSPVSIWEAGVLLRKRRLRLTQSLELMVAESLASGKFEIAPVSAEVALAVGQLPFRHFDPADSLIAATARVYGLILATSDRRLLGMPGLDCLRA